MKTKHKIFLAKILVFFLTLFINQKQIVKRKQLKWELDLNEGIDLSLFLFGLSEQKIILLKRILKNKKSTFIDIGANIGSVTLPLVNIFNKSLIYAIEPTFYAYKKLKKNISLNKSLGPRIVTKQQFISNSKKPTKVWSSWGLNTNEKLKHNIHRGILKKIKKWAYISLDKFIKVNKIKNLDFIKIDVDGHELDVLKSGFKSLKKLKPIIFIEFCPYLYPKLGINYLEITSLIKKIGYVFYDDNLQKVDDINVVIKDIPYGAGKNFFLLKR